MVNPYSHNTDFEKTRLNKNQTTPKVDSIHVIPCFPKTIDFVVFK